MDSPCIKQTVCIVLKIFQHGKYFVAYVLNASKNAIFTIYPALDNAPLAFVFNEKHETMVAIPRQYPFGTDKAVQISRAVCCDKGTQPQYFNKKKKKKKKSPY